MKTLKTKLTEKKVIFLNNTERKVKTLKDKGIEIKTSESSGPRDTGPSNATV